MNFLEHELNTCIRRIQKIEQSPDPTKPKANKILYELERDFRIAQLDAWKAGEPFAGAPWAPLVRAMGFWYWDGVLAADRTHGPKADHYFKLIRSKGLPEHACDRTVVCIPMVTEGDFPPPQFLMTNNFECSSLALCINLLARELNIPTYSIDIMFRSGETNLRYVTGQLEEMIRFVERKFPTHKFSADKLVELQHYDKEWYGTWKDIYELRKRKPCPIAGREAFREARPPSIYHDPKKAVDYLRAYRDELGEWAGQGRGAVPDEKLRLMWCVSGPFYADPFKILESRGVAVPWWQIGPATRWSGARWGTYGDETEYGRRLSPLEEEARLLACSGWGGLGNRWVEDCLIPCRDLGIEGIVYFEQWGCTVTNSLGEVLAEVAERELGIPTLRLEGRMLDTEAFDREQFEAVLHEFVDLCLERKSERASLETQSAAASH